MKVYLTRRNRDMIEGMGPMVNDLVFLDRKKAEEYIDSKPGVMGMSGPWSTQEFGDWDIVELDVIE